MLSPAPIREKWQYSILWILYSIVLRQYYSTAISDVTSPMFLWSSWQFLGNQYCDSALYSNYLIQAKHCTVHSTKLIIHSVLYISWVLYVKHKNFNNVCTMYIILLLLCSTLYDVECWSNWHLDRIGALQCDEQKDFKINAWINGMRSFSNT